MVPLGSLQEDDTVVILLADDEASVRRLIEVMLGRGSYRLLIASDGAEALGMSRAYQERIHLLLSDIDMPGMSGVELAHSIVAERPEVRVLLISADPVNADRSELPFIAKPFTRESLRAKIQEVLRPEPLVAASGRSGSEL